MLEIYILSFLECGDFHSLKWYRDTSRVYVYSPAAQFSNAEGSLMDRWLKHTVTFAWPFSFLINNGVISNSDRYSDSVSSLVN